MSHYIRTKIAGIIRTPFINPSRSLLASTPKHTITQRFINQARFFASDKKSNMTSIQLNCLVHGDTPAVERVFPIKTIRSETVGNLKDLIKEKNPKSLGEFDARNITLWGVDVPSEKIADKTLDLLKSKDDAKVIQKLDPMEDLSTYFPETPAKKHLHVIAEPPAATSGAVTSLGKRKWLSIGDEGPSVRPKLAIKPYDYRVASLVLNKDEFKAFPVDAVKGFERIRTNPRFAYFDRTSYISVLESLDHYAPVFLRPRRFGKSLFLSTLAHFHGVENKQNYEALFKGLDVDRDVKSGKVTPGQYLILAFDFSKIDRSRRPEIARDNLSNMMNTSIEQFYQTYAPYLGEKTDEQLINEKNNPDDPIQSLDRCIGLVNKTLSAVKDKDDPLYGVKGVYLLADEYDAFSNEYLNPDDPTPWEELRTDQNTLLKGFWGTVKSNIDSRGIAKCFITGVSPVSMADHTSGFNIARYISWYKEFSGLCGLTKEDVLAALKLPEVCRSEDEVQKHFDIMKTYYDGYNFTKKGQALDVFNTNTCLEYLQSLKRGEPIDPMAVSNSEVSEPALQILAASSVASRIISDSLENQILPSGPSKNRLIPYEKLTQAFRLSDLSKDIQTSKPAWLSYMLHIGGLTFCHDAKQLQIPNLVAAERFGKAALNRLGLRLENVSLAFQNIVSTGDIKQALKLYQRTMNIRDVGESDYKKSEEHHRDSFYYALLSNPHPSLQKIGLEVQVTKGSSNTGRIDMLIRVPSKKRILLLEWKVAQIGFLDIDDLYSYEKKAEHLSGMFEASYILDLKFNRYDKWRPGQTIKDWILNGPLKGERGRKSPRQQLAEYIASPEITQLKKEWELTAYLIVIVGSRQVLFWKMNNDGEFREDPQLAT